MASVDGSASEGTDPFERTSYRALAGLGRDGNRDLFAVEHRTTGRECVATIVREELGEDAEARARLWFEAKALGKLEHPHIVAILAAGEASDRRPFFVTERVHGPTLAEILATSKEFSGSEALRWIDQLLSALVEIHRRGIGHRGVTPKNLRIVARPTGARWLKLGNFGNARWSTDEGADLRGAALIARELLRRVRASAVPDAVRGAVERALDGDGYRSAEHFRATFRVAAHAPAADAPSARARPSGRALRFLVGFLVALLGVLLASEFLPIPKSSEVSEESTR